MADRTLEIIIEGKDAYSAALRKAADESARLGKASLSVLQAEAAAGDHAAKAQLAKVEAVAQYRTHLEKTLATMKEEHATAVQIATARERLTQAYGRKVSDAAGGGGLLAGLKSSLGNRSDFKEVFELLQGGGAVAGLTYAGRSLNQMSEAALRLKNELKEGKISAGEMTEQLAASVPIYGEIWQAGRNIRELITGEKAAEAALRGGQEASLSIMQGRLEIQRMALETIEKMTEETRKLVEVERQLGMGEVARSRATVRDSGMQERSGFSESAEEGRDRVNAKTDKEMKSARAKLEAIQRERKEAEANFGFFDTGGTQDQRVRDLKAEEAKVQKDIEALARDRNEQLKKIDASAHDGKLQSERTEASRLAEIQRQAHRDREQLQREHQERMADLRSEATEATLRAAGKTLEADIEADRRAAEGAKRGVDSRLREQVEREGVNGEESAVARKRKREAEEEKTAIEERRKGKEAQDRTEAADKQAKETEKKRKEAETERKKATTEREGFAKTLDTSYLDYLEREAQAGKGTAKVEAERLRIAEQYRQEREKLAEILKSEAATEEQKQQAAAQIARLSQQEQQASQRAGRGPGVRNRLAETIEGSTGFTGLSAAYLADLAARVEQRGRIGGPMGGAVGGAPGAAAGGVPFRGPTSDPSLKSGKAPVDAIEKVSKLQEEGNELLKQMKISLAQMAQSLRTGGRILPSR